ncbi:esterase-like activity of phytase family protein [Sulfitobacter noctilucae]|uniref:esterase-like activity of phytase family protein n=1 Tax=Sulfitobacter noctilucae TaxID=1342302 RepID=UPI00046AC937|nr:esterase-like activity of phytase family protein [Sulfitobacter noctilucae]
MIAVIVAFCAATFAAAEPRLRVDAQFEWTLEEDWFGGFSGMEVSPDGNALTLITDRSSVVRARLVREQGRLLGVQLLSQDTLKTEDGGRLRGTSRDSEGLAIGRDGQAYVSFEAHDKSVGALDLKTGRITPLPDHPDFAYFSINTGLEALAVHPDGRLFTLSEMPSDSSGTTPLFKFRNGNWRISHRIPLPGPFRPVGADFDDAGRLYLLERTITPLGFRSQIRRFDLNADPVVVETLLTTFPAAFDNLEALSVWTDAAGTTRVIVISDDNFISLQTTQIVEFVLTE